jgi:hypothetical protein
MFSKEDSDILLIKLTEIQLILKDVTNNCNNFMHTEYKQPNPAFDITDSYFIFMHDSLHDTIMKLKFSIIHMSTARSNELKAHQLI